MQRIDESFKSALTNALGYCTRARNCRFCYLSSSLIRIALRLRNSESSSLRALVEVTD